MMKAGVRTTPPPSEQTITLRKFVFQIVPAHARAQELLFAGAINWRAELPQRNWFQLACAVAQALWCPLLQLVIARDFCNAVKACNDE